MFAAKDVDLENIPDSENVPLEEGTAAGRGFAVSGGVASAVADEIRRITPDREVKIASAQGLHECKKMLTLAKAKKYEGYLLEGMGCPGGCVAGAGTISPVRDSAMTVEKFKNEAPSMSCTESPYLDRLEEVEKKYEITPHD